MRKVPKDYRQLDTCETCKHAFILRDISGPYAFYCHYDKSKRPKCGDYVNGVSEYWFRGDYKDFLEYFRYKQWMKWDDAHSVTRRGWCSKHEKI